VVLVAWCAGFTRMLNTDLWFHLAIGRLVVSSGSVPAADPWSYTVHGAPWHNHEWLSGVIFHLWERWLGLESLVWWQWGLLSAIALVLYALLRPSAGRVVSLLLATLALVVASPFFDIRPHLWSLLGFLVVLQLALRRRWPLALPIVFAFWANLHAGVTIGLIALAVIAGARALTAWREGARPSAREPALLASCVLATFANPFGWRVLAFPLEMAVTHGASSSTRLGEWVSPLVPGGIEAPLYLPAAVVALPLIAYGLLRGWRTRSAEFLAASVLALLTLAMSLNSRRFIPLFALAGAVLASTAIAGASPLNRLRVGRVPRRLGWIVVALVATVAVARLSRLPLGSAAFLPLTRADRMPVDCLRFLARNQLAGNVFAFFLWGGYVPYADAGALRVFIDPRSETVYPTRVRDAYDQAAAMGPGWQDALRGADFVLWPFAPASNRAFAEALLAGGRWRLLYSDSQGLLLVRRDLALPPLVATPDSGWRSFGLARQELARGRADAAERHLEDALRHEPQLAAACVELLALQRQRGAQDSVARSRKRCDEIFPGLGDWGAPG
jgi:hypothetical protein